MASVTNSGGSYLGAPCLIDETTESPYTQPVTPWL